MSVTRSKARGAAVRAPHVRGLAAGTPPMGPSSTGRLARPALVTFGSLLMPDGGLQVRSRVLAESLAGLGIRPAVVSTRESLPTAPLPDWARSMRVPHRKPKLGFSFEIARLIRAAAAESDVVIIANAMFMPALALSRTRLPVVWDTNECQTLHYARLPRTPSNRAKHLVWLGLERWAARRCSVAIAIGEAEAAAWRRIHPALRTKLETVDHAAFSSAKASAASRDALARLLGRPITGPVLVFVGTMTAKHNAVAARWIIESLAPTLPAATTVVLCGPGSRELQPAATEPGARVACLGTVDDVDSVIAAADLCLAPLAAGAGVKTKVLHYLVHGRRIAGTPLAFEGVAAAPGLFAADLEDLPALIARLGAESEDAVVVGERIDAQRAWVEQHHGRLRIVEQWRTVLQRLPVSVGG